MYRQNERKRESKKKAVSTINQIHNFDDHGRKPVKILDVRFTKVFCNYLKTIYEYVVFFSTHVSEGEETDDFNLIYE